MNNHYLNQKYSIPKASQSIVKKKITPYCNPNPWLIFFNQQNIKHQILSLEQNDIIVFNTDSNFYIILLGSVIIKKVLRNANKITLNVLTSEDTFGHKKSINNFFYYEIEAIDTTQIISIKHSDIINICKNYPTFNIFFLNHLLLCTIKAHNFIEVVSHKSITNRLISLLLLLSEQSGTVQRNGILINLNITHKLLAQIIGSNRVSVTRIMSELIQTKLVTIQKKKIIINNPVLLSLRVSSK